ncbi:MAG TPA: hypothetical protein VG737_09310 [Cyclobacteriaceae bacterium]|nr:hypothetical protein [Cyclobacteriaceae bacterium]
MPLFRRPNLILSFVLCVAAPALGQDTTTVTTNSIGLGTGYAYAGFKSEKFSALMQTGSGLPVQAYFRRSTARTRLHFQAYYTSLSLTSGYATLVTREHNGQLQFGAHYRVGNKPKKITTWIGFVLDAQGAHRDFSSTFGGGTAENNSSDEGFLSLNPSVLFEHKVGSDKLGLQIWASILAYVVRPVEGTNAVEGKFVSLHTFSKTEARLSYSKYFSRRWEGRIDGQFQFYALSLDQTVYKINSQLVASIAYKL